MEITTEHKKAIEEIICQMKCPKNFECCKSGFAKLGSARDIGMKTFVECLGERGRACSFALKFGNKYLCYCPLCVYLVQKLGK